MLFLSCLNLIGSKVILEARVWAAQGSAHAIFQNNFNLIYKNPISCPATHLQKVRIVKSCAKYEMHQYSYLSNKRVGYNKRVGGTFSSNLLNG